MGWATPPDARSGPRRGEERIRTASKPAERRAASERNRHLKVVGDRIVDEDGQVLDGCVECVQKERTIEGLQAEIRSLATKLRLVQLDDDEKAARDELWPRAVKLFDYWRDMTGHLNCQWTADRFWQCRGTLKRYDDYTIQKAIAGIAYDPMTKVQKNGRTERFDHWETLFKKSGSIEWYANKAPREFAPPPDMTPTEMQKDLARFVLDRARVMEAEDDAIALTSIFVEMDRKVRKWVHP